MNFDADEIAAEEEEEVEDEMVRTFKGPRKFFKSILNPSNN